MSLLTCAQVAEDANTSIRTVQRWVKTGELVAHILPGGDIRIDPAEWRETLLRWSTAYTRPDNASGAAQRELPAPGTGGASHASR
jgi:excisionase family DNA binding protein